MYEFYTYLLEFDELGNNDYETAEGWNTLEEAERHAERLLEGIYAAKVCIQVCDKNCNVVSEEFLDPADE